MGSHTSEGWGRVCVYVCVVFQIYLFIYLLTYLVTYSKEKSPS